MLRSDSGATPESLRSRSENEHFFLDWFFEGGFEEDLEVEGVAGDGLVKVKMDGNQKLIDVNIDPDVKHEDIDLLEDLILIAVNQAVIKSHNKAQMRMNEVTGNIMGNVKLKGRM